MVNILIRKYRFVLVALFVFADILLLSLIPPVIGNSASNKSTTTIASQNIDMYDGPNAVTNSMVGISQGMGRVSRQIGQLCINGIRSVGVGALNTRNFIFASVKNSALFAVNVLFGIWKGVTVSVAFVGSIVHSGITLTANALSASVSFMLSVPADITNFFLNTSVAASVIKPAHASAVPIISTAPKNIKQADIQVPAVILASANNADSQPQWPIHGAITTLFGVPHWPYQRTHTGLDISDNQRSGVTPVHPFKPGRVVEVVRSNVGLGNHVVVDHGNGLVSLYGHLASINVQTGQEVDKNAIIGREGSTGASTGTHLHFEIRLNGKPVNPLQYVSGRP